jgi:hypothetical protein
MASLCRHSHATNPGERIGGSWFGEWVSQGRLWPHGVENDG